MKITEQQHQAAYQIAMKVYDREMSLSTAASVLKTQYGLNEASAKNFVGNYKMMRMGLPFHRAMSLAAHHYFLDQIQNHFGTQALATAVDSLAGHIHYYENSGKKKTRAVKLRALLDKFRTSLSSGANLRESADYSTEFEAATIKALRDTSSVRKDRIQKAPKYPKVELALTKVFLRNPDVAAEVLSRAHGVCEGCRQPAPFFRKKDLSPYLEVHHKVRLADGGEDSVQNAIALCPNCHRKMHFGV